jgi:hypothetical protein
LKRFLKFNRFLKLNSFYYERRFIKMNKKGEGVSMTGVLVAVVLLVVLMAIVVYGFTVGWGDLWNKVTGFGGGKVNVQSVIDACKVSCSTNQVYEYCTKTRSITFAEAGEAEKGLTCKTLEARSAGALSCDTITCPAPA